MIRLYFISLFYIFIPFVLDAQPRRIYVNAAATGTQTGVTWAEAFADLQGALKTARAGDSVWVARGVYKPTTGTDRGTSFEPKSGVRLYGGFSGRETALYQRDWRQNPTVLSGDIGIEGDSTDNSYNVMYLFAPDSNTVVDGLVFRGGNANYNESSPSRDRRKCGGGLYVGAENADAYPMVRHCVFTHNTARNFGGGAAINGSGDGSIAPRFVDCRFEGNRATAGNGGGLARLGASWVERGVDLLGCVFLDNWAGNWGGGFYWSDAERTDRLDIDSCVFVHNEAKDDGSAVFLNMGRDHPGDVSLKHTLFDQNIATNKSIVRFLPAGFGSGGFIELESLFFEGNVFIGLSTGTGKRMVTIDQLGVEGNTLNFSNCNFTGNKNWGMLLSISINDIVSSVQKNLFSENQAEHLVFLSDSKKILFRSNRLLKNEFKFAIVQNGYSQSKLFYENCVFYGNISTTKSEYVLFQGHDSIQFTNLAFVGNRIQQKNLQGALNIRTLKASNCIFKDIEDQASFFGATIGTTFSHCYFDKLNCSAFDTSFHINCGPNNLVGLRPLFRDSANQDFRLSPCSPLIDAGLNSAVASISADLGGTPRVQGPRVDIGPFEAGTLQAAPTLLRPACGSLPTGHIALNVENACPPYNYAWRSSNGSTGTDTTNLAAGAYFFSFSDGRGAFWLDTLVIPQAPAPSVSLMADPISCGSTTGGSIRTITTGGTSPFAYRWSDTPNAAASERTGLAAGFYGLTATDQNGCQDSAQVEVALTGVLQLLLGGRPISCFGRNDGALSLAPLRGQPPFAYHWDNNTQDSLLQNIGPGRYSATVTDAYGCSASHTFELFMPDSLRFDMTATKSSGSMAADGSATVAGIKGGTSPYQYDWSTGAMTQLIEHLLPGIYTATVTDNRGCSATQQVEVSFVSSAGEAGTRAILLFYPNPAQVSATVTGTLPADVVLAVPLSLRLYNTSGDCVKTIALPADTATGGQFALTAYLDGLPAGIYQVVLSDRHEKSIGQGLLVRKQ